LDPWLGPEGTVVTDRRADRLTLGFRHRCVDRLNPSRAAGCRSGVQRRFFTVYDDNRVDLAGEIARQLGDG